MCAGPEHLHRPKRSADAGPVCQRLAEVRVMEVRRVDEDSAPVCRGSRLNQIGRYLNQARIKSRATPVFCSFTLSDNGLLNNFRIRHYN